MTVRARVFSKDGNRFLIPGYWCDEDDPDWDGRSMAGVICDSMMMSVVLGLDPCNEWLELAPKPDGTADVLHYLYELHGPQFQHGRATIFLISGPLFDAEALVARLRPIVHEAMDNATDNGVLGGTYTVEEWALDMVDKCADVEGEDPKILEPLIKEWMDKRK